MTELMHPTHERRLRNHFHHLVVIHQRQDANRCTSCGPLIPGSSFADHLWAEFKPYVDQIVQLTVHRNGGAVVDHWRDIAQARGRELDAAGQRDLERIEHGLNLARQRDDLQERIDSVLAWCDEQDEWSKGESSTTAEIRKRLGVASPG